MSQLFCIGHRGAAGHAPENTLLSVQKALDIGVDCVEVDVYWIENELIVFHDDTLERTTNGRGLIQKKSLSELRELDAGKGEKIPFLYEVLDLIDKKIPINIELKGAHTAGPVANLISEYMHQFNWHVEDFIVSSFDHEQSGAMRKLLPNIRLGCLFDTYDPEFIDIAKLIQAYSVNFSQVLLHQQLVQTAHQNGFQVYAYTVNHPEQIKHLSQMGVDGVFSNYPDRVVAFNRSIRTPDSS